MVNVTQEDLRGANITHNILTSLKQTMNTGTVLAPRFNAHVGMCVRDHTVQYITGLTRFHTVTQGTTNHGPN